MLSLSDSRNRKLIYLAGLLYTLSLHKYFSRDALSPGTGVQGYIEGALICAAFLCSFLATTGARRQYGPSLAVRCFIVFGMFALASSVRSFNPTLSIGEGILFIAVLGMGYLASQAGLDKYLFQSIYWTFTGTLAAGLVLGVILPSRFPVWSIDEFTGRTRLSVFGTFPGTMGETAAYLALLSPILFVRAHWISRIFLIAMNIAAGGKTSTVILLLLLAIEIIYKMKLKGLVVATICFGALASLGLYVTALRHIDLNQALGNGLSSTYGHDVGNEAASLDGRIDLWKASAGLLLHSPILGYGFDGAREILLNVADWSGSSHNGFLELGLTAGIFGMAIVVVAIASVLKACIRSAPALRRSTLIVFVYMIGISLTGITFNFPSYFGFLILIFLLYRSIGSTAQARLCESSAFRLPILSHSPVGESCRT